MPYAPKDFSRLLGTPGFSDQLLKDHFTLYEGYVKNTNTLLESTARLLKEGKSASPEFAELKRRFGWEFNGMRLHEIYFDNISRTGARPGAERTRQLMVKDFGSFESWADDFKATGSMRGVGWAAVYWDPAADRLFNSWINEHDGGDFAGCPILLLMDVFEHAFMRDYGTKRKDYIEAFFRAIDWQKVEMRFEEAHRAARELSPQSLVGAKT